MIGRLNVFIIQTVIVIINVVQIYGINTTETYMTADGFQSRQHRLLSFNTDTDGDVSVELAFNVPFIRIPVKKAISSASGAVANLNIGAVILAGSMVLGMVVILPGIINFATKKLMPDINLGYRNNESGNFSEWWRILTLIDQALIENNIDTTSCMQRAICTVTKNSSLKVLNGHGSSREKIIDGLATNEWLNQILDGTVIQAAVQSGLNGISCSNEYSKCKITRRYLQTLMQQFTKSINP